MLSSLLFFGNRAIDATRRGSVLAPLQQILFYLLLAFIVSSILIFLWYSKCQINSMVVLFIAATCILLGLCILVVITTIYQFAKFAEKNPDLLRSEHYGLQTKLIDKGNLLDDQSGTLSPNNNSDLLKRMQNIGD